MTERFFIHCVSAEDEQLIYALAMAYKPSVGLLAAMLETQDLTETLGRLSRRYPFVLAAERQLHRVVQDYVLEKLLLSEDHRLPPNQACHQRALNYLDDERNKLLTRCETWAELFADERWLDLVRALIWHSFWLDESAGWDEFSQLYAMALLLDRNLIGSILGDLESISSHLIKRKQQLNLIVETQERSGGTQAAYRSLQFLQQLKRHWPKNHLRQESDFILDLLELELALEMSEMNVAGKKAGELIRAFLPKWQHHTQRLAAIIVRLCGRFMWPAGSQDAVASDEAHSLLLSISDDSLLNNVGAYYKGVSLYKRKDYGRAEAAYRKAIELDEKYAYPWNGLGNLYRAQKKEAEAEAALRKAIELDEKFATPWNGLGNLYSDQKKEAEAEAAYRKAIELDEKFAYPWNGLGNLYRAQKKEAEAEAAYRQAMELDEKFAMAWNGLGNLYSDQKKEAEAEAAYRKAIELDDEKFACTFATPWNGLGNLYSDQKKGGGSGSGISEGDRAG